MHATLRSSKRSSAVKATKISSMQLKKMTPHKKKRKAPTDVYEAEFIADKKVEGGKVFYLVKWLNYPESQNTWEPEENILGQFLLDDFKARKLENTDVISDTKNTTDTIDSDDDKEDDINLEDVDLKDEANSSEDETVSELEVEKKTFSQTSSFTKKYESSTLEVVFSFDTTGNMYKCLERAKCTIRRLTTTLITNIPGIRIGVIAHGDYCDKDTTYVFKKLDFCTNPTVITNFVLDCGKTNGGDPAECYEYVLQQAQQFSWTPGSNRVLVMIGDDVPHKPNEYLKIDWCTELEQLVIMSVKIYAVQCHGLAHAAPFYAELAGASGGVHVELDASDSISTLLMGTCYHEASELQLEQRIEEMVALEKNIDCTADPRLILGTAIDRAAIPLTDKELLTIHQALHTQITTFSLNGTKYTISNVPEPQCSFVNVGGITFIAHNVHKKTLVGKPYVLSHKKITWMTQGGGWSLMMDDELVV